MSDAVETRDVEERWKVQGSVSAVFWQSAEPARGASKSPKRSLDSAEPAAEAVCLRGERKL